jgi:hypothetical protein
MLNIFVARLTFLAVVLKVMVYRHHEVGANEKHDLHFVPVEKPLELPKS